MGLRRARRGRLGCVCAAILATVNLGVGFQMPRSAFVARRTAWHHRETATRTTPTTTASTKAAAAAAAASGGESKEAEAAEAAQEGGGGGGDGSGVVRRYILLRHGQTDMNAAGIIQGSSDRSRLTPLGRTQARDAARGLAALLADDGWQVALLVRRRGLCVFSDNRSLVVRL